MIIPALRFEFTRLNPACDLYADVNVIDFANLQLPPPVFVQDLPAGGCRYIQKSSGYQCTLVNGQVFMEGGEHTGALAGQVLRSA